MYCRNCGKQLPDGTQFCTECGKSQVQSAASGYSQHRNAEPSLPVTYLEAIKLFFTRYVDFKGRSRRSEYWWAMLFTTVIGCLMRGLLSDISWVWSLATLIPGIAICFRRLHDVGKSGWWYLLNLIPLVGQIILIVWFCKDSAEENQWGPNPKY